MILPHRPHIFTENEEWLSALTLLLSDAILVALVIAAATLLLCPFIAEMISHLRMQRHRKLFSHHATRMALLFI